MVDNLDKNRFICALTMFDGKVADEGKSGGGAAVPTVDVTRIEVTPNMCNLENELRLTMDFATESALPGSHWEIKVTCGSTQHTPVPVVCVCVWLRVDRTRIADGMCGGIVLDG